MNDADQIFGWTGPTPVGVGCASYLQVFNLGGLTRFVIRGGDGLEHHIDVPAEKGRDLAREILEQP